MEKVHSDSIWYIRENDGGQPDLMPDEMFFSKDERSLIRGSRTDPRTETCRPCVVELHEIDSPELHGVVLDVTPRGMLVRMLQPIPLDTVLTIQLMRDDKYQKKLSTPHVGRVVRIEETKDGFFDHGLHLVKDVIPKASERPVHIPNPKPSPTRGPSRMQTVDITSDNADRKRGR